MSVPRPEYPRPQFVRPDWLCLNGVWQFEIDSGDSGLERGLLQRELSSKITVPFCPESELSGIGNPDFLNAVWYRRTVAIPKNWAGKNVLLHFQACDYDTTVWVNGKEVRRHRGGFTPFTCNLKGVAEAGKKAVIVVRARDNNAMRQPRGKQVMEYANSGCMYTRTTGIWQTVWMEPVPECALLRPRITPDVANGLLRLEQPLNGAKPGYRLEAILRDKAGVAAKASCAADIDFSPQLDLAIPSKRRRFWSPSDPHLYQLQIKLLNEKGQTVDSAASYAGLRSVKICGPAIKINGETIFQRLVLDQGYYPDGILTAPNEAALVRDIELSLAAGFNGARLHQKVFEERFLYHADRLGYLVWGEFPDWGGWGTDAKEMEFSISFITEWLEVLARDYSHPSIVGWCPLNETGQSITDRIQALDDVTRGMFLAAKAMDCTRPVLDASGYSHRVPESDVCDLHDYDQNPQALRERHLPLAEGQAFFNGPRDKLWSIPYNGQPFFNSEFGGIRWNPDHTPGAESWGYGERPKTLEEFYTRFEGLCAALLDNPGMFGYCYTQLTDVYQEQNGIYFFDRRKKFDMERIRKAQQRPATIEKNAKNKSRKD